MPRDCFLWTKNGSLRKFPWNVIPAIKERRVHGLLFIRGRSLKSPQSRTGGLKGEWIQPESSIIISRSEPVMEIFFCSGILPDFNPGCSAVAFPRLRFQTTSPIHDPRVGGSPTDFTVAEPVYLWFIFTDTFPDRGPENGFEFPG